MVLVIAKLVENILLPRTVAVVPAVLEGIVLPVTDDAFKDGC